MGVRPSSFFTLIIHQPIKTIKEEDMFIWQMVLVALGVLVLILIIGIAAIAVKSIIAELKKGG
ncbi:TPA: hypothetical protein ACGN4E_000707 [Streptococcus agalactiae]|uniref:hypothetical protein n=1 Tax=Streptococcus agalactiae TaxID=1311 RepID=UPI00046C7AD4|nr:hypothetical protein [Streptococcus agalactiae]KAA8979482.1 hypothetical protein F3159_07895 [Streptococcus agalactiae]KAA8989045.1 hypothetical protein F3164_07815 [Streptococcus agalactiae]KAA9067771.1 hypothetical protein F5J00_07595 [Streptococcus agalactiae]KAA9088162.1 hypothetical protein F5S39_04180 [Streptococcus agalactiae]HEN2909285.1 hypothetical protein [Streptococcus agalactiae]